MCWVAVLPLTSLSVSAVFPSFLCGCFFLSTFPTLLEVRQPFRDEHRQAKLLLAARWGDGEVGAWVKALRPNVRLVKLRMRKDAQVTDWTAAQGTQTLHDRVGSVTFQPWWPFYTICSYCFSIWQKFPVSFFFFFFIPGLLLRLSPA